MKSLLICLAILFGQMNSLQDKPVVHLPPNTRTINVADGGKLLELINAPAELSLPGNIPKADAMGQPWEVDVKNLGPSAVTVVGKPEFNVQITPGQTVHIHSNGKVYSLQR
ncbi:hypothetical protein ACFPT7_17755 [Acidicapsa dinghuensis]|uniref:Uncharacterized protein n=1 Tax=Acidicapsa dinghuensis TaxID=2218256 RepID=A0ABW1EIQ2_9BACT|nr:hypothetical protein [Acidicapsa dinghuensis]